MKIEYHSPVCLLNMEKMVEGWLSGVWLCPNLSASPEGSADNLLHIRLINLT